MLLHLPDWLRFRAWACTVLVVGLFCVASLSAEEQILTYHSDITVAVNGQITVTETIKVLCQGQQIRHGIYRDFPTDYNTVYLTHKTVPFDIVTVLCDGRAEAWHTVAGENGQRLYIGSANALVTEGVHEYALTYRTNNQLGNFDDHDELYWNVTGNGWVFKNVAVTADVHLPAAVRPETVTSEAYTGYQGQKGRDFTAAPLPSTAAQPIAGVHFIVTRPLQPTEGFTIVVSWPKGSITRPSTAAQIWAFAQANPWWVILLSGCVILPVYYLTAWWLVGRDPKARTIIPLFEPPAGWSPAAIRFLVRMEYDQRCMAATVLNLAALGHIHLTYKNAMYSMHRRSKKVVLDVTSEESVVLFNAGDFVIDFQSTYNPIVESMSKGLKATLEDQRRLGFFERHEVAVKIGQLLGFAGVIGLVIGQNYNSCFLLIPYLAMFYILNRVFSRLLRAYTKAGRQLMDQIEGFKRYLSVAEKDRLEGLNPPEKTPELFEKFLPYALALGVENHWAEQFADVLARVRDQNGRAYQPYGCYGLSQGQFATAMFVSSMTQMSSNIGAGSTPPPQISSGSGGGSSGGGGGGSSGGGGGGGGGGGW